jgi:hypothetical protein
MRVLGMARPRQLLVVSAALAVVACASYEIRQVEVHPIESYARHVSVDDISFAIDVYDTPERCEAAFDKDLTSENYYAVHLLFRSGTDERLLIARATIELVDPRGGVHRPVSALNMARDFENSSPIYTVFGAVIAGDQSPDEVNRRREADWYDREIPEHLIIEPGHRGSGFAYFRLPEGRTPAGMTLRLKAERIGVEQATILELPL